MTFGNASLLLLKAPFPKFSPFWGGSKQRCILENVEVSRGALVRPQYLTCYGTVFVSPLGECGSKQRCILENVEVSRGALTVTLDLFGVTLLSFAAD